MPKDAAAAGKEEVVAPVVKTRARTEEKSGWESLAVGAALLAGISAVLGLLVGGGRRKREEEEARVLQEAKRKEMEARLEAEKAEAASAEPACVVVLPRDHPESTISQILLDFESLRTFDQVADWDARAKLAAEEAQQFAAECEKATDAATLELEDYEREPKDPTHVAVARIAKARASVANARQVAERSRAMADDLWERVELTPDNAKEQRALLKELRAQKRALMAQKKETRADMANLRREAREASAAAAQKLLESGGTRRQTAEERRRIREAKDASLRPHEDEMAALERQVLSLERRILWVQRFGDDGET